MDHLCTTEGVRIDYYCVIRWYDCILVLKLIVGIQLIFFIMWKVNVFHKYKFSFYEECVEIEQIKISIQEEQWEQASGSSM